MGGLRAGGSRATERLTMAPEIRDSAPFARRVAVLPSHKVLFGEGAADTLPAYKKLRASFRVEDA